MESIGRGFKLLAIVCRKTSPLSLSELSKESDLSISTIQRLSYTLQRLGFLDRDQRTKKFKIGPEMISLSFAVIDNLSLKKVAFPYMQQLSKQLGEVVALATLSGTQIILIESIKTQEETFGRLKNDRQYRAQVRLITDWVDEAVKLIKYRS